MKQKNKKSIRLAKFLAEAGVSSRRKSEELIKAGRVKIADKIVNDVASNVFDTQKDIKVDNKQIILEEKVYYLLNKPKGCISSLNDPHNSKTVTSLVPKKPRVVPVGRLDKDSSGLLLLSNNGELIYKLTHPKFKIAKTYIATVNNDLDRSIVDDLKRGVKLTEGLAKADRVKILDKHRLEIVIHQGWNRQIRRMIGAVGLKVIELKRMAAGKLSLGNLAVGEYKKLNLKDIL